MCKLVNTSRAVSYGCFFRSGAWCAWRLDASVLKLCVEISAGFTGWKEGLLECRGSVKRMEMKARVDFLNSCFALCSDCLLAWMLGLIDRPSRHGYL
jgi:hypothetical protein